MEEALTQYVKERIRDGYTQNQIRHALAQQGHSEAVISEALASTPKGGKKPVLFLLLFLVVTSGVIMYVQMRPVADDGTVVQPIEPVVQEPTSNVVLLATELRQQERTPDELYYAIIEAALRDAKTTGDGILLCSINSEQSYKNYCLQELAQEKREPTYCEVIGSVEERDECYLGLILAGEDQYCSKLLLEQSIRVCTVLVG